MSVGYSIHVGLNSVDPDCYAGWSGRLQGCLNDARAMVEITAPITNGRARMLTNSDATAAAILAQISAAAASMVAGDLLVLTYSGHGGQMPDPWGLYRTVETWCAWDRQILGHELAQLWAGCPIGARVVVVSDSCHAGTVTRDYEEILPRSHGEPLPALRVIPQDVQLAVDAQQRASLVRTFRGLVPPRPSCPVYLLAACQANQLSSDGPANGLYTERLLQVWDGGKWIGGYPCFSKHITRLMPPWQTPALFVQGPEDAVFLCTRPFSL